MAKELEEVRAAIGFGTDVATFVQESLKAHGAIITPKKKHLKFDISEAPRPLKENIDIGDGNIFNDRFDLPVEEGIFYFNRAHAIVESLATFVMNTSLDLLTNGIARRCGVIRTDRIERRTTFLLVRFRYHPSVNVDASIFELKGA